VTKSLFSVVISYSSTNIGSSAKYGWSAILDRVPSITTYARLWDGAAVTEHGIHGNSVFLRRRQGFLPPCMAVCVERTVHTLIDMGRQHLLRCSTRWSLRNNRSRLCGLKCRCRQPFWMSMLCWHALEERKMLWKRSAPNSPVRLGTGPALHSSSRPSICFPASPNVSSCPSGPGCPRGPEKQAADRQDHDLPVRIRRSLPTEAEGQGSSCNTNVSESRTHPDAEKQPEATGPADACFSSVCTRMLDRVGYVGVTGRFPGSELAAFLTLWFDVRPQSSGLDISVAEGRGTGQNLQWSVPKERINVIGDVQYPRLVVFTAST
jgi:hypothetical protein